MTSTSMNVLVPTFSLRTSSELLTIAGAVLDCYGGQGTVLSVVEVPEERSLSEGALLVRRRRSLVRRIADMHGEHAFGAEVRTAHGLERGIRDVAREMDAGLLLLRWKPGARNPQAELIEQLGADPPCDLAVVKAGKNAQVKSVLVPARGGPHARLALRIAEAVAAKNNAVLTLAHITVPYWSRRRRVLEQEFFRAVCQGVRYGRVQELEIEAVSIEEALRSQGGQHDLVVMGASARDADSTFLFGRIPEVVARKVDSTVVIVKTQEPVTRNTFGLGATGLDIEERPDISEVVDRWFAENTFHSREFHVIRSLVDLKERQGKTISVVLPALNEEKTIGKIITTIKRSLIERYPLIDELTVIDSDSDDRTVEIAESLGVAVYKHPEILPNYGSYRGKGEALWKSLYISRGDIIVWIDSDITGIHPQFVYGLLGPLLTEPHLGFVKGFYRRPLRLGGELLTTGGGRVTELTARPLINLFYPQLSGLVQPLAGEMAGRREVLESVPFFTGYGVEIGLLIDILQRFGIHALAQADLEYRVHRNQSLLSLSKMAFAIVQVVIQRLGEERRLQLLEDVSTSMKLIHYSPTELFLEVKEIHEHERPPIHSLPEYAERPGVVSARGVVTAS